MKINLIVKMLGMTVPVLISACSTHTPKWQEENKDVEKTNQKFQDYKSKMKPDEVRFVEFNEGYYVDKTPIQIIKDKKNLPTVFYKDVEIYTQKPITLNNLAGEIFKQSDLSIKFIDNKGAAGAPVVPNNSSSQNNNYVPPPFPEADPAQASAVPTSIIEVENNNLETDENILIDYNGELRGLLDYIAVKKSLKWRYDSTTSKVFFYPFETETFTVFAVAENINLNSTITTNTSAQNSTSSEGSDSESGTTNEQEITFEQEQKYWDDVSDTVKNMLSTEGRVSFNKTQGKVTVTDNDYTLSQIKNYLSELNSDAYKQITVDFKIVNLKLDDTRDLGINMNIINDELSLSLGANALTAENAFSKISWKNSSGDSILLNILDSYGTVKVDTNISVVTVNNMPVPVQVTQNQAYIKERRIESGSTDAEPIEEVVTDTISQGVTATITPKAIGNNVLLSYSMNLSVIDELATAPGDTKIQLPITSTKNFVQKLTVRNGESKVVAAFEKIDSKSGSTHPLNSSLWFLGGQETFSKQKEIILLIATPYISTVNQ